MGVSEEFMKALGRHSWPRKVKASLSRCASTERPPVGGDPDAVSEMSHRDPLAPWSGAKESSCRGARIMMRRREADRSELFCGSNKLAGEASWPSQAPIVYLRRRTENFHV